MKNIHTGYKLIFFFLVVFLGKTTVDAGYSSKRTALSKSSRTVSHLRRKGQKGNSNITRKTVNKKGRRMRVFKARMRNRARTLRGNNPSEASEGIYIASQTMKGKKRRFSFITAFITAFLGTLIFEAIYMYYQYTYDDVFKKNLDNMKGSDISNNFDEMTRGVLKFFNYDLTSFDGEEFSIISLLYAEKKIRENLNGSSLYENCEKYLPLPFRNLIAVNLLISLFILMPTFWMLYHFILGDQDPYAVITKTKFKTRGGRRSTTSKNPLLQFELQRISDERREQQKTLEDIRRAIENQKVESQNRKVDQEDYPQQDEDHHETLEDMKDTMKNMQETIEMLKASLQEAKGSKQYQEDEDEEEPEQVVSQEKPDKETSDQKDHKQVESRHKSLEGMKDMQETIKELRSSLQEAKKNNKAQEVEEEFEETESQVKSKIQSGLFSLFSIL